jgi:hypothetical protein
MLRFFRQIRQKLLENGNIRKYIWYALGEFHFMVDEISPVRDITLVDLNVPTNLVPLGTTYN